MKYIEADRLKEKLDEHYRKYQSKYMETRTPYTQGLIDALDLAEQVIDSLQQEQPDFPTTDKEIDIFLATHPKVEVPNKYKTPDWLWDEQERPKINIPSAGSGAMGTTPPKFKLDVKQDLPVGLEKEIKEYLEKLGGGHGGFVDDLTDDDLTGFAHHFYELGINARKK